MYLLGDLVLTASTSEMGISLSLDTINMLRYMLIGSLAIFLLGVMIYFFLFAHKGFIFEFLFSIPSAIFHAPTYLIVFELFALARLDKLSISGHNSSPKIAGIK